MDDTTRQATRLWTSAQPVVAAFVAAVVRNHRDREDVLQETALAVLTSFEKYDPAKPFNAWALGVARNQIGLYLRRLRRDRLVFSEETVAGLQAAFDAGAPPPELDYLPHCIDRLDDRARTLCDLRYQEGMKPAAISERVGMSPNAVSKALQRVREQLRACLESRVATEGPGA